MGVCVSWFVDDLSVDTQQRDAVYAALRSVSQPIRGRLETLSQIQQTAVEVMKALVAINFKH